MEPIIFVQKAVFFIVLLLLIVILMVVGTIVTKESEIVPVIIAAVAIVFSVVLTYKMTICVDNEYVWFSMGIGLIRRSYEISSISDCRVVKNYHSGAAFSLHKQIFSVGGSKAVELHFTDSKKIVLLGTNEPDKVCKAINDSVERNKSRKKY